MKLLYFLLLLQLSENPQLKIISLDGEAIQKDTLIYAKPLNKEMVFEIEKSKSDTATYFFKLENFDNQWIKSKFPSIRYTNLPGGDYVFNWKVHNGKVQTIKLKKESSLIEEWWFLPALIFYIVLLISAAIYFFMLYNLRQKVKIQAIRNRIASDLHDEVGSTLNSISIFTRIAEKKLGTSNAEISELLDKIKTDSDETVLTIRDTVWAINPENDNAEHLFEKIRALAFQILTAKEITFDFDNEIADFKSIKMNMEQRRNVYMICKEVINNILKHAQATVVKMKIFKIDGEICLKIEDNGVGFDINDENEGNGVKNYQKRATEGILIVNLNSIKDKGTTVEILIPSI